MAFSFSPKIVTDGLVLYLDAANTKSYPTTGTVWSDLSRSGNNGTLINGPTFNSANGGSIVFDGVNHYILVNYNSSLSLSTQITFTSFIKLNSLSGFQTLIHNKEGVWNGVNGFYAEWRPSTKSLMLIGANGVTLDSATLPSVTTNTIQEFGFTVNGTTVVLYMNGSIIGGGSLTINAATNNYYINSFYNNASFLNGLCYNVKLYNRALTAQEILQNFNATKGRFGIT